MFFGLGIGPFIVGGSSRQREDVEPEPFHEMSPIAAGGLVLVFALVAICFVVAVAYTLIAWVESHGGADTLVTALWFLVGIPVAMWVLHALGSWAQRRF